MLRRFRCNTPQEKAAFAAQRKTTHGTAHPV